MNEQVQQTDPAARTETGELVDARDRTQETTTDTTQTATTQEPPKNESENQAPPKEADGKAKDKDQESFLNAKDKDEGAKGAPEKYEAFTLPEGVALDEATINEATTLFKELELPQAGAQKLVDLFTAKLVDAVQAPYNTYREMRDGWRKEILADPNIGPRTAEVKTTIGRAIDATVGVEAGNKFRQAMDITGAGDNPEFVRTFYAMAKRLTEGKFVVGNGPSDKGQGGAARPQSIANALYPNNP